MSKRSIVAMCMVAMAVAMGSSNAWAVQFRNTCVVSGDEIPATGPTIPFHTVSTTLGHWTSATTVRIDSGSLTVNAEGIICSYTVDTTQTSTSVFSSDGTGTNTTTWKPAASNSASCQPEFTGHEALTLTSNGALVVGTDPGETASGSCVTGL